MMSVRGIPEKGASMSKRQFKHLPGPYRVEEEDFGDEHYCLGPHEIKDAQGRTVVAGDGGLFAYETGVDTKTLYANARLLAASPSLVALLAEIETAILPLLPDIDPVMQMRAKVKELLDTIEKGEVSNG